MKLKIGLIASVLGLIIGLGGCANQDDDIIPAKRPGFRPPSTPLVQDELPQVDPLGVPAGNEQQDAPTPQGGQGIGGAGANTSPARSSAPQTPAPLPDPVPQPVPAPQNKTGGPEYAKRSPRNRNWIISPYDGKTLDATGFPPGTEVRDPQSGKIMLVP
jgi:hypothetical protein